LKWKEKKEKPWSSWRNKKKKNHIEWQKEQVFFLTKLICIDLKELTAKGGKDEIGKRRICLEIAINSWWSECYKTEKESWIRVLEKFHEGRYKQRKRIQKHYYSKIERRSEGYNWF